jgi:cytochrome c peroxidase
MKTYLSAICGFCLVHGAFAAGLPADADAAAARIIFAASIVKPLPAPPQPGNILPLSPVEQLGKNIFFDRTFSSPEGYSCATCHIPQSGFTGSSSLVNQLAGPMPGVIAGRFGKRKPQAVAYSTFSPDGPYFDSDIQVYLGGNFWDGRAPDNAAQARMPFLDQNEMANLPVGPFPPHAGGFSPLVAGKLKNRPYAGLVQTVFGRNVFRTSTDEEIYELMTAAIAMYEASAEVNPFSSKFDASKYGTPPYGKFPWRHYQLTASEENGRELFFGQAQCFQCHSSATLDPVLRVTNGKNTFTMYCYANIGVPKNPANPFYSETNAVSNPNGFNALGADFIDYGLGGNPNPAPDGTLFMNETPGDLAQFRGLFKAPSLRNVDKRPNPNFVKSYMHNGVFKSLPEVVHFYNKRNIATNAAGDEIAFDLRVGAPAGYTPIFPAPEVLDNVQNAAGVSPDNAGADVADNGQVGNLGLTAKEEADVVNFLKILSDGYTFPNPVNNGNSPRN